MRLTREHASWLCDVVGVVVAVVAAAVVVGGGERVAATMWTWQKGACESCPSWSVVAKVAAAALVVLVDSHSETRERPLDRRSF